MLKRFENRVLLSAPHMSGLEQQHIQKAFAENWVTPLGPNVTDFEKQVVEYLGEQNLYAVAMSSGTAAIHIALRLLNVQPNEEIFCSSATFIASANPILYEKAIPVFIDSEAATWNLCPKSLLKAIEIKKKQGRIPRILICVDLFGMSANYSEISEICRQYDIRIIEDAAESLGSSYKNQKCGTFGDYGILSFNGNKII
ncbi:MAG: DegT/DnrJ/EryC1/StrS family aminotransferase, partial [Bdellovibrionota bacterium]